MRIPASTCRWTRVFRSGVFLLTGCLAGVASAQDVNELEALLSTPVSTAARYEQTAREAPASVTVITADEIARYGYRTLAEALQHERGFYASYDRLYAYLGARGFGRPGDYNTRILVQLDGLNLNEYVYGSSFVGTDLGLPLEGIERIEVVRGPGSALYGSSAMFAVVNLIPKEGRDLSGVRAQGEAGTARFRRGLLQGGLHRPGGLDVAFAAALTEAPGGDLYFPTFDAPETNDGLAEGQDGDRVRSAYVRARRGAWTAQAHHKWRRKGIPTGAYEVVFNGGSYNIDQTSHAELRYARALTPALHVTGRAHGHRYYYLGYWPYEYEGERYGSYDATDAALWGGGEVHARFDTGPANRLVGGAELVRHARVPYRSWDPWETYVDFDQPFTQLGLFVQDEYQATPDLALTVGLRYDHYSHAEGAFSPRAGAVYTPLERTALKLLYGMAHRVPTGFERLYDDPYVDHKPNPDLVPERVRTLEAIWEQAFGARFSGTVSAYAYRLRDLIDTAVDPADEMTAYQNVGRAEARGIEAEVTARLPGGGRGYASYTLQEAHDGEDVHLTNSPHHLLRGGLHLGLGRRAWVAVQARYESGRQTVHGTHTDPFGVLDTSVGFGPLWGGLDGALRVRNALDARYSLPGGYEHTQPALPQDGRAVCVTLSYTFSAGR